MQPRYGDFSIFQNGSRPPSWICHACAWTAYEEHLVVLIVVQNLISMIGRLDWKICEFQCYASLAEIRRMTYRC